LNIYDKLGKAIVEQPDKNRLHLRVCTISAVDTTTNTVSVLLPGTSTAVPGVPYLPPYSPSVNDVVQVLQDSTQLFVLGKSA